MNRFALITIVLVAALSLVAGGIGYLCLRHSPHPQTNDPLGWLRQEFQLDAAQLQKIEQLHNAYALVCIAHCDAIRSQRAQVEHLQNSNAPASEIAAAKARAEETDAHCMDSVQTHAREVAAVIGGEQGKRYLAIVLPRIAGFDHSGTPDLTFTSPQNAPATCH